MISDVLPVLSERGLRMLDQDFAKFQQALTLKSQQADVTWQALLRSYLFQDEADKIKVLLN